ncbi:unnamed protein product [Phytophthora fragariaefolia]|uniref:Unnamed protein product n=1 Tax=Phytophthora fragariaefolia TaxID=1490495 RepID=A0A9W6XLT6_9STRA|nr:unnamed protein product [Phytophthora fragariaefolia]
MGRWMKIVQKRALIWKAHASPELSQGDLAAWAKTTYKLRTETVSNILKNAAAILSEKYSLSRRSRLLSRWIPTPLTSSKLYDGATRFGKKSVERIPSRTVSGTQTSATWSARTKIAMPLSAATVTGVKMEDVILRAWQTWV